MINSFNSGTESNISNGKTLNLTDIEQQIPSLMRSPIRPKEVPEISEFPFQTITIGGEITSVEYQWVTDLNRIKIIDRQNLPDSLLVVMKNIKKSEDRSGHQQLTISFREIANLILNEINLLFPSLIVFGQENPLPKGFRKYVYRISYDSEMEDGYQRIRDWIDVVNYPPLILSVDESKYQILPGEMNDSTTVGEAENIRLRAMAGLRTIIKALVQKKEQTPIRNVIQDTISTGDRIKSVFTPYDENNRMIYVSPEEESVYRVLHPLEIYWGWRYLSDSKLTLYVLEQTSSRPPIREIEGIYIIPTMSIYNPIIDRVEIKIRSFISQKYVTLNIEVPRVFIYSSADEANIDEDSTDLATSELLGGNQLYFDLLARFDHRVITRRTNYLFDINEDNRTLFRWCELNNTCNSEENRHNDSPPENLTLRVVLYGPPVVQVNNTDISSFVSWLDQAVMNIMADKLPMVTLRGRWQDLQVGSKMETIARLNYLVSLAYRNLVSRHPHLSSSILLVTVMEDLSIMAPLTSQVEKKDLVSEIKMLMSQDDYTKWSLFPVESLLDLVKTRWTIKQKFPKVLTYGTRVGSSLYVVSNRMIDPLFLEGFPWDYGSDDLVDSLTKFFRLKLSQTQSLSIDYYLTHVPVVDISISQTKQFQPGISLGRSDIVKKVTMINRDQLLRSYQTGPEGTISDQAIFLNPSTLQPITEQSLSRVTFYPRGWMGLFDIKNLINSETFLSGIYTTPPTRKLVPVELGQVVIDGFLPPDSYQTEFVMTINVKIIDSSSKMPSIIPLFDLSYNRMIYNSKKEMVKTETGQTSLDLSERDFMKQIEVMVDWLWSRGWFLSPWVRSLSNNEVITDEEGKKIIRRIGLSIFSDNILKEANQDPISGERAIKYLNQVVQLMASNLE